MKKEDSDLMRIKLIPQLTIEVSLNQNIQAKNLNSGDYFVSL